MSEPVATFGRPRAMPRLRHVISTAIVVVLAAACSAASNPEATGTVDPPPTPLLTVHWRGGLCPQGLCERSIEIDTDGTVREPAAPARVLGRLAPPIVDRLADAMAVADFVAIEGRPFTGTCPMAYDGQEIVYTFHARRGDQVVASCTVAIDTNDPLFRAADAAIAAIPAGR